MSFRSDRLAQEIDAQFRRGIADQWWETCRGARVGLYFDTPTGTTEVLPTVTRVHDSSSFAVELPPGMIVDDLRKSVRRLAAGMGAEMLRIRRTSRPLVVRVELLAVDPLAQVIDLPEVRQMTQLWIARTEDGDDIVCRPDDLPHLITQGKTRSGKSAWCYSMLSQVAHRDDVLVAGVDASGLLLRPFTGTRHAAWQAVGLRDLGRVERVLAQLVAEMDRRIGALPLEVDRLTTTAADPLVLVVLEEWPGVLRALDTGTDKTRGKRCRALVARLLAESHKAGFRCLTVAQRAEANLIGGAERDQCDGRLTFRVGSNESIKLLHPDAAADLVAGHDTAPDGVCLLTWPGVGVVRARAPWIGSYRAYCRRIAA